MAVSAALVLGAACEDLTGPGTETLPTADLLILPTQPSTPNPMTVSFWVPNARAVTESLVHPDAFNSLYARLSFPRGSVASVDGVAVGPSDSTRVTVQPRLGAYGITISPDGLTLADGITVAVTFSVGNYGDRSVADGSTTYTSRDAYSLALEVWLDISPGTWQAVPGSGATGVDAVQAELDQPGRYVVAAPR